MTLDITWHRFGRLVPYMRGETTRSSQFWHCVCDCGNRVTVRSTSLRRGESKSCGCLRAEVSAARATKHGHATTKTTATYNSWAGMRQRCTAADSPAYENYGGRGITVCARWETFENFLADMGEAPAGTSIDRINNDGNYEPANCRWATAKEQANNRRKRRWWRR